MKDQWNIHFWGTRGSIPRTGKDFLEYGGNTSCISVDWGGGWVVFDAGSGLVDLGQAMKREQEPRPIHILFSHVHMDHILGLFGFGQLHDPRARIHLYGEARAGASFRKQLEQVTAKPYWPLGMGDYQARIQIHQLEPGQQFCLEGSEGTLQVRTLRGRHPGESILYRLDQVSVSESAPASHTIPGEASRLCSRSLVYGLDCELDEGMLRELAGFAAGTDLIVCDAHFTEEDLKAHQGWGHSSWKQGVTLRQASGASRGVMMHFSPEYTDAFLRQQEEALQAMDGHCCFAREGMEIKL